jgi:hypothetical protein
LAIRNYALASISLKNRRIAMRALAATHHFIVPLLEGFNFVGYLVEPTAWDESEAGAVRLGQRRKVDPDARRRGLKALSVMRTLAENGTINLIYTDGQRRRVPYFQSSGYWLSAIYPDPVGDGEGMIELDDRYIHPCVVDIRKIIAWRSQAEAFRTGPKRSFLEFEAALEKYFQSNPISKRNAEVRHELGKESPSLKWPAETRMHELINDARDRAKAGFQASVTPERTPDGH